MRSVNAENLEDLRALMQRGHPDVLDEDGHLSIDLPTFGGPRPEKHPNAWSWDRDRVLIGECDSELTIVPRYESFDW